mmetsp:Transcript_10153/g.14881  ORF Transcript_10153/g.14881 Transcript_10153/m.14881 type:complete len:248 (+) Transcript_10153:66-809(+)
MEQHQCLNTVIIHSSYHNCTRIERIPIVLAFLGMPINANASASPSVMQTGAVGFQCFAKFCPICFRASALFRFFKCVGASKTFSRARSTIAMRARARWPTSGRLHTLRFRFALSAAGIFVACSAWLPSSDITTVARRASFPAVFNPLTYPCKSNALGRAKSTIPSPSDNPSFSCSSSTSMFLSSATTYLSSPSPFTLPSPSSPPMGLGGNDSNPCLVGQVVVWTEVDTRILNPANACLSLRFPSYSK